MHLNGSFYVARAAAPHFRQQASGSYVHMTSTSGLIGNIGQANYSAAKMGIAGLSKSIALDMAKFNVRSNCIAPWAWTAMTATIPADTPENIARIEKMKKMESAKIAPLAVYLASDAGGQSERPDLRRARQRDLLLQPDSHDSLGAPLRRLDPGVDRRTRNARLRVELLPERAVDGTHALGPDLTMNSEYELVGLGIHFDDLPLGRKFKTVGRTITETDIVLFINTIGMTEVLFTNYEFMQTSPPTKARVAPGSLVFWHRRRAC